MSEPRDLRPFVQGKQVFMDAIDDARPPDPDALRELAEAVAFTQVKPPDWLPVDAEALKALQEYLATGVQPVPSDTPDLAALLHPWTCAGSPTIPFEEHAEGGWLCQRAAADIAFRLGLERPYVMPPMLDWPDHADMSVDERR